MDNCRHYAWDLDDDGTLYCTYCDMDLSEKEKYKSAREVDATGNCAINNH